MRKQLWGAAVLAAGFASQAAAVNTEKYQVPYFGLAYDHMITDSSREAGDGQGFQLTFGVPFESGTSAIEVRFFDAAMTDRFPDDKKNFQSGLMVDYVRDFGPVFTGVKPFVTAGKAVFHTEYRQTCPAKVAGFSTILKRLSLGVWRTVCP